MGKINEPLLQGRAAVLKALAHPSRLFIIDELAKGSRCVCELTDLIGADVSTVSKHLSVLKNAGLVQNEKKGLNVHYSLKVPCILNFFSCIEAVLQNEAQAKAGVLADLRKKSPRRKS